MRTVPLPSVTVGIELENINPAARSHPHSSSTPVPASPVILPATGPAVAPAAFLGGSETLQPWEITPPCFSPLPLSVRTRLLAGLPPIPLAYGIRLHPRVTTSNHMHQWTVGLDPGRSGGTDLSRYNPQAGISSALNLVGSALIFPSLIFYAYAPVSAWFLSTIWTFWGLELPWNYPV